jgi:hypothetical protein
MYIMGMEKEKNSKCFGHGDDWMKHPGQSDMHKLDPSLLILLAMVAIVFIASIF